jgi:malate-CoA ligase subunit alpha
MGHAGAIVNSSGESAAEKVVILEEAGIMVVPTPSEMGTTMQALLKQAT